MFYEQEHRVLPVKPVDNKNIEFYGLFTASSLITSFNSKTTYAAFFINMSIPLFSKIWQVLHEIKENVCKIL